MDVSLVCYKEQMKQPQDERFNEAGFVRLTTSAAPFRHILHFCVHVKAFAASFIKGGRVSLKSARRGHRCQRESASLESAAKQNFDTLRGG